MKENESKVFVIGLQKTGTMTMFGALNILGYTLSKKYIDWKTDASLDLEGLKSKAFETLGQNNAFVNNPWPILYEELYEKYPTAKFILTLREEQEWLTSACKNFSGVKRPEFSLIYDIECFSGNEERFLSFYKTHNATVQNFFSDKPESLLVTDVTTDGEWDPLCRFLDKPIPDIAFPHKNKTGSFRHMFQKHAIPATSQIRALCQSFRAPPIP